MIAQDTQEKKSETSFSVGSLQACQDTLDFIKAYNMNPYDGFHRDSQTRFTEITFANDICL